MDASIVVGHQLAILGLIQIFREENRVVYRTAILCTVLFFTLMETGWSSETGCSGENSSHGETPGAGQKVYVDPDTGELLSGPPASEQPEASSQVTQAPPPTEIQQEVRPDGTVVADIGDRFITELRVEIVDGKAVTCHRPAAETQPSDPETPIQADETPDDGH